jgi:sugar phosphate isomerase/epimerase
MATPGRPQLAANYYLAPPQIGVSEFMGYAQSAGASGIGLTLAALVAHGPEELAELAAGHGLFISTLNSAGYFLFADDTERTRQDELNIKLIDAAARMRAGRLVVIAGGMSGSGLTLEAARGRVAQSLAALNDRASAAGVRLALEPVHPADLTTKGCINSIRQALDLVQPLSSTDLVIDTFHSAWDPDIWRLPTLAGDKAAVVQVCNWYEPSPDEKPQRDLPSLGAMDLASWLRAMTAGGFAGPIEFEMFDRHRRGRPVLDILTTALRELREMMS